MTPAHPLPCVDVLPQCEHRFAELEEKVKEMDSLQRQHDRKITQLEVKVAVAAGLGAVLGSVGPSVLVHLASLVK